MPDAVEIRPAPPEALAAFVELLEEAGAWLWERGVRQWPPGSSRAQQRFLRRLLADGALVVASGGEGLAGGYLLTSRPSPEWAAHTGREPRGSTLYLHKLAVARCAAGRSLGARLLADAEARARAAACTRIRLDCWDGNDTLRAWYRAAGYDELEAVPSHGAMVRLFEKRVDA